MLNVVSLRVEFLLKTNGGYPRDAKFTLFTLANPGSSLRFNTNWSAPPVSALARSGDWEDVPVTSLPEIEHRGTYGHASGRGGGRQGSSVNRQCQLSFVGRLWHLRSQLSQGNQLLLNVSVRCRAG